MIQTSGREAAEQLGPADPTVKVRTTRSGKISPRKPGSRASLFVWGVWALMLLIGLAYVAKYAHNVPYWDDWDVFVPYWSGMKPLTLRSLWEQHNEHRLPLMKLLVIGLVKLTGFDFRAVFFFNVLALGGMAFAMIQIAKRLRGWTSYADALFPVTLLHLGHFELFFWAINTQHILGAGLLLAVLYVIVRKGAHLTPRAALLAGVCLAMLPVSAGGPGVVCTPALSLWLGWASVTKWFSREIHAKRDSPVMLASALLAPIVLALYFVGWHSTNPDALWWPGNIVRVALQWLTLIIGPSAGSLWPYTALIVAILFPVSAGLLLVAMRRNRCNHSPADRGFPDGKSF
jgi:hypothetical protein